MNAVLKACVSRSAVCHNARLIMNQSGGKLLCAMVKANAYGHGTDIIVRAMSGLNIPFWGVACIEEALELRALSVTAPILLLRPIGKYMKPSSLKELTRLMRKNEIRATVIDDEALNIIAHSGGGKNIRVHIKIDTGMGRNGCEIAQAATLAQKTSRTKGVTLEGIYSHFASADGKNLQFAREQLSAFNKITKQIALKGIKIPLKHMANSAAIFNLPESYFDMVRPGLALYGYGGANIKGSENLIPALKVIAPILAIKNIKKGSSSGYGSTFVATRDTRAGLLPIGYADGYSRKLSNKGKTEVRGLMAPVIGRISMDLTMIDLTDIPAAKVGDEACIIGNIREAPNSVEATAKQLGTIPYEVTSVLGNRIKRIMID